MQRLILMITLMAGAARLHPFSIPDNCTAFLTKKDMLFAKNREVQGNNCGQKISVRKNNGKLHLQATIPSDKFQTGNSRRDQILSEILGKEILFLFSINPDDLDKHDFSVKGDIVINKEKYPAIFRVTLKDSYYIGVFEGKLTSLGITPPTAGPFGAIANTHDFVKLGFRISRKIIQEKMK